MPPLPPPAKPGKPPFNLSPEKYDEPSLNELKVLYALARAGALTGTVFGPTTSEAICACWNYSGLQLSKQQLRDYVRRLEWKECVERFDFRGELTYSVTPWGRNRLIEKIHPEISEHGVYANGFAEDPKQWAPGT